MTLKTGMVGLTNVGKTTIFNAITASDIEPSNYTFATIDPNKAVVNVPDSRVDEIFANIESDKKVYSTLDVVDIAGLIRGASSGEGLGNKFLSDIKQVDAVLHIVRCFDDDNIVHVDNSVNPIRDIETIETELIIKDLETVTKRIEKNTKLVRARDKEAMAKEPLYNKLKESLEEIVHPRDLNLSEDEITALYDLNLITLKPQILVCNISEEELLAKTPSEYTLKVMEYAKSKNCVSLPICGKVEAEIAQLEDEEKVEFIKEYGLTEPGLNALLRTAYNLLGLITFLTEGEIEVRAWNIKKGTLSPQAAGVIHTDFEKKFIKAEVISYSDFKDCGFKRSEAKKRGLARLEGKTYEIKDGDVIIFRIGQ
ncbi:MAG: redox-regulated ATPase YchF [Deltaproteobacteria bacterium]|nr:redox-regulated ATPase YchF [Deltaproteobacteria bacterium]